METKIKLVAIDIDGTLLDDAKRFQYQTLERVIQGCSTILDIVYKEVGKADALKFLANYYCIDFSEVAVIGVAIDMLMNFSMSFAMGNATN